MSTTDAAWNVSAPKLTPDEVKGLQDFWEVYQSHHKEIRAELLSLAGEHPESKLILQSSPSAEGQERSLELLRRAIYHNEWEAYQRDLQSQGRHYAQQGFSYDTWMESVMALRKHTMPYLMSAYGNSV